MNAQSIRRELRGVAGTSPRKRRLRRRGICHGVARCVLASQPRGAFQSPPRTHSVTPAIRISPYWGGIVPACDCCGDLFRSESGRQRYCSAKCRYALRDRKRHVEARDAARGDV